MDFVPAFPLKHSISSRCDGPWSKRVKDSAYRISCVILCLSYQSRSDKNSCTLNGKTSIFESTPRPSVPHKSRPKVSLPPPHSPPAFISSFTPRPSTTTPRQSFRPKFRKYMAAWKQWISLIETTDVLRMFLRISLSFLCTWTAQEKGRSREEAYKIHICFPFLNKFLAEASVLEYYPPLLKPCDYSNSNFPRPRGFFWFVAMSSCILSRCFLILFQKVSLPPGVSFYGHVAIKKRRWAARRRQAHHAL